MSNLTVVIDDALLRSARIKALEQGTSVNEICRQAIESFVGQPQDSSDFLAQLKAISERIAASRDGSPLPEKLPSRNEMMEEAMAARMPSLYAAFAPEFAKAAKPPKVKKPR